MPHTKAMVVLTLLVFLDPLSAAWITIKNDTGKIIVIQETRIVNGKLAKGKSFRMTPGEVLKEFHTCPGEKTLLVSEKYDTQTPVKEKITWHDEDATFSVTKVGTVIKLAQIKPK
ncbi:MAG TPA: hypothetical protein VGJ05_20140 [Fimbriiglobus sp.]